MLVAYIPWMYNVMSEKSADGGGNTYTPDIAAGIPMVTAALVGFVQLDMVSSPLQSRRKRVRSVGSIVDVRDGQCLKECI
jgi:hypothetical protein